MLLFKKTYTECVLECHVSYVQSTWVFLSCCNLPWSRLYSLDGTGIHNIWPHFHLAFGKSGSLLIGLLLQKHMVTFTFLLFLGNREPVLFLPLRSFSLCVCFFWVHIVHIVLCLPLPKGYFCLFLCMCAGVYMYLCKCVSVCIKVYGCVFHKVYLCYCQCLVCDNVLGAEVIKTHTIWSFPLKITFLAKDLLFVVV